MNQLKEKIYGCIAGSNIGSAMGAEVECWSIEEIMEKFDGELNSFHPYRHYLNFDRPGSGRERYPGTTEDGIERQRLLCETIARVGGRIDIKDVAQTWLEMVNPDNFCVQMEPCDEPLYRLIKAGFYPEEIGRYVLYNGLVSCARSHHPIGLINACNPDQAVKDTFEVGRMFQNTYGYGLDWAAAVNGAIAEALKPDATIDSVLQVAIDILPEGNLTEYPKSELKRALAVADECDNDWRKMRYRFNDFYIGRPSYYDFSMAHEIVSKGFAIFKAVGANTKEGIIAASNFGRDTDCAAAVAGGLCGALTGMKYIPDEWVEIVDGATKKNDYTVSKKTMLEHSEAIYQGVLNEMEKSRKELAMLEQLLAE